MKEVIFKDFLILSQDFGFLRSNYFDENEILPQYISLKWQLNN